MTVNDSEEMDWFAIEIRIYRVYKKTKPFDI